MFSDNDSVIKNDTFPVITRSTFGQSTKGFPLHINCSLLKLNNVHFPRNYIIYVTLNTNFLQNVFFCQLLLRQVSASVPDHLQGARDFLGWCNLRVNVCGRDSTNKLSYKYQFMAKYNIKLFYTDIDVIFCVQISVFKLKTCNKVSNTSYYVH